MFKAFYLILVFSDSSAVIPRAFPTLEACQSAAVAARENYNAARSMYSTCVPVE